VAVALAAAALSGATAGVRPAPAAPATPAAREDKPVTTAPSAATPQRAAEIKARAEAVAKTVADLTAELKAHGGTYEAWAKSLDAFRQDIRAANKQPDWVKTGREGWHFMNKDLDFVLSDRVKTAAEGVGALETITDVDRQLKAHGIDLIVVLIPDKLVVYADKLCPHTPRDGAVAVAPKRLMLDLAQKDVEVVDLYTLFHDERVKGKDAERLYQKWDTHWHNAAARLAAKAVAERLKRYEFVKQALAKPPLFTTRPGTRPGDGDMANGRANVNVKGDPDLVDKYVSVLKDGRPYEDAEESPVLVMTDSFGEKNMANGGHFAAHVALNINLPVSHHQQQGGGAQVPTVLAREDRDTLPSRRVVVWTMVARTLSGKDRFTSASLFKPD
jgi:hypothetical protein